RVECLCKRDARVDGAVQGAVLEPARPPRPRWRHAGPRWYCPAVPAILRWQGANVAGPLAGIRVIDVSEGAQGPWAGSLLADLGADVIKVEKPEGEMMRNGAP